MKILNIIFDKKGNDWERLDNNKIPNWIWKMVYNSPNQINYYKGNTFRYKVLKDPGRIQGEYIYTIYRKIRKKIINNQSS